MHHLACSCKTPCTSPCTGHTIVHITVHSAHCAHQQHIMHTLVHINSTSCSPSRTSTAGSLASAPPMPCIPDCPGKVTATDYTSQKYFSNILKRPPCCFNPWSLTLIYLPCRDFGISNGVHSLAFWCLTWAHASQVDIC